MSIILTEELNHENWQFSALASLRSQGLKFKSDIRYLLLNLKLRRPFGDLMPPCDHHQNVLSILTKPQCYFTTMLMNCSARS